jgi:hypothetical protein
VEIRHAGGIFFQDFLRDRYGRGETVAGVQFDHRRE